jgi:hypothetical protein
MSTNVDGMSEISFPSLPQRPARCMRDLKSKLAIETNRLTGWKGTVFERRYDSAVVTDEEGAQIERLLYLLSNSVKEGLGRATAGVAGSALRQRPARR